MKRLTILLAALLPCVAFCATGCDGASKNLISVEGTISQNGEPLDGVKVHFRPLVVPEDFDDATTTAVSDASGRYALSAPSGKYRVSASKIVDGAETLPAYCRPIDSPFLVDVSPSTDASTYDFDLE